MTLGQQQGLRDAGTEKVEHCLNVKMLYGITEGAHS